MRGKSKLELVEFLELDHWPKIIFKQRDENDLNGFLCEETTGNEFCELFSFDLKKNLKYKKNQQYELKNSKITPSSFEIKSKSEVPNEQVWNNQIQSIQSMIHSRGIDKLVLSRKLVCQYTGEISLTELIFRSLEYSSYFFMILWDRSDYFLSKTPECLFSKKNGVVSTEALAGTLSKNKEKEILLNDRKELEEHRYVVDDIKNKLSQYTDDIKIGDAPFIFETNNTFHLKTKIEANISEDIGNGELVNILHPTAALGGFPSKEIISKIREIEGFDRNFYGAPIILSHNDKTECLVGIRSLRLKKSLYEIYAGAGIVYDSNPDKEWNETEIKMENFKWLFR